MPSEIAQQFDLFTGALVETRASARDRRGDGYDHQLEMFSAREIAQFGVNAHPLLAIRGATTLALAVEDPRTDEEKERDAQRAAEEQTHPMFSETTVVETASVGDGEAGPRCPTFRVETVTNLEGVTRSYLHEGDDVLVMTTGAMYWCTEEVAAQQVCVAWIAAVLNQVASSFASVPRSS